MVEIKLAEKTVSKSKNLRGILSYARQFHRIVYVTKATATRLDNGRGLLNVEWNNGATAQTEFADYNVLVSWINARRTWGIKV